MVFLRLLIAFFRSPRSDEGATAVEYALLVGLIAAGLVTTVGLLGDRIEAIFTAVRTAI